MKYFGIFLISVSGVGAVGLVVRVLIGVIKDESLHSNPSTVLGLMLIVGAPFLMGLVLYRSSLKDK